MYLQEFYSDFNLQPDDKPPDGTSKMHQRRCEICGRWSTVRNMKRHMDMVHGSPMQVQCPVCEKTFKWKDTLRRHLKTIHYNEAGGHKREAADEDSASPSSSLEPPGGPE